MKWILRSAFAAASLGSVAPAFAQSDAPPTMPPPVPPAVEPGGFSSALPVVPPAPASAVQGLAAVLPKSPPADWVPAASGPKSPPAERVQWAIPDAPGELLPTGGVVPPLPPLRSQAPLNILGSISPVTPDEPPRARPDFLPPFAPGLPKAPAGVQSGQLPAPPSPGLLPPIPVAPPVTAKPNPALSGGAPAKPGVRSDSPAPVPLPAFPDTASGGKGRPADALPPLPPELAKRAGPGPQAGDCPPCACAADRVNELVADPVRRLCPQDGPVRVRGWLDGGYAYNTSNPASKFNGPYNSVDRANEPMFNQLYAIIDSPLRPGPGWGAGFRADVLYGLDHWRGQSRGFEVDRDFNPRWNDQYYGLALPQLYGEVGNDVLSVKLGHFYSLVGYEMLPAVANFFYTHAYSYQFGQPFTHWGGVATTQFTRNLQAQVGLVNGWDALVGRTNNVNLTGSLRYTPDSQWWWGSFAFVTGDEQTNPAMLANVVNAVGNRTRYDLLLGLTPGGPCGRWEYVFHHYYGWQENGTPSGSYARWYGIDQYLYYRVSRTLRWGTRFEWFRDEDGTQVGLLNRPANPNNPPLPGNYFALTTGLNYVPRPNFVVRPEVRWDFTTDTARPAFSDGKKNNQLLLACDLIWLF